MNKNTAVVVIILFVIIAGGWFYLNDKDDLRSLSPENTEVEDVENVEVGSSMPVPGTNTADMEVFCTQDAMQCPDGSFVSRVAPDCAFAQCPLPTGGVLGQTYTVNYTNSGFSPSTINIKIGDTVKFVNQSSSGMWVGSNDHPTHTLYGGTTLSSHCGNPTAEVFDQCRTSQTGTMWSFTFNKVGTWSYHNHRLSSHGGNVVVSQ